MKQAVSDVQIDNELTRVTRWTLAPGAETGHHRHEMDYVIVPVSKGMLTITANGESKEFPLQAGGSYFRLTGVEHNVINNTGDEIVFVEVEFKP